MDLITIIIPYYKKKKYIKKTLKSIFDQTYRNYEVILIYDDVSLEDYYFLKSFIKNKKFNIIKNNKNLGAGTSRNLGIAKAKGKYIAFIDADDIWEKSKLQKQLSFMKKNNYFISHTDYLIIKKNNKKFLRVAKKINYLNLLKSCDVGLSTVMILKKKIGKIKFPNIKTKEDYVFWLKFLKKNSCNLEPLNKKLTRWNETKDSLSSNNLQKIRDTYKLYRRFLKFNIFLSVFMFLRLVIYALKKKLNDRIQ